MKQKILVSGLCLTLALSLVSCGGQQTKQEPQEPKQEVQQTEPVTTEPTAEPMEAKQEVKATSTQSAPVEGEQDTGNEVDPAGTAGEAEPVVELFTEVNETVYATDTVNIRSSWSAESEKLGGLNKGDSVTRTGISIEGTEAEGWSRIQLSDGRIVYVSNKYLSVTRPTTQSSSGGGSTTQTKPQGQQGQQGQTQQQGQQNQQPTGDTSGGGSREDFINNIGQVLDNAGYTPGSKAPLTADEKAGIADAISGRGGQTQGNPSGKTPEQVKAEEEATQKALDDMLNDWLSGN